MSALSVSKATDIEEVVGVSEILCVTEACSTSGIAKALDIAEITGVTKIIGVA